MNSSIKYFILFIALGLIQSFLLKNLYFGTWFIPFAYPYALVVLKPVLNRNIGLVIGFLYGLLMDVFYNTTALHALACTTLMFFRPFLLNFYAPRKGYDDFSRVSEDYMGMAPYWFNLTFLFFIHHLVLFSFEAFDKSYVPAGILRALTSSIISLIFVFLFKKIFLNRIES